MTNDPPTNQWLSPLAPGMKPSKGSQYWDHEGDRWRVLEFDGMVWKIRGRADLHESPATGWGARVRQPQSWGLFVLGCFAAVAAVVVALRLGWLAWLAG